MPEKYEQVYFSMSDDVVPEFTGIETVDCPNCRYRIPVKCEFTDYKLLYESQLDCMNKMRKYFDGLIQDMASEIPEVKVYLHNERAEILQKLEELSQYFKDRPQKGKIW